MPSRQASLQAPACAHQTTRSIRTQYSMGAAASLPTSPRLRTAKNKEHPDTVFQGRSYKHPICVQQKHPSNDLLQKSNMLFCNSLRSVLS